MVTTLFIVALILMLGFMCLCWIVVLKGFNLAVNVMLSYPEPVAQPVEEPVMDKQFEEDQQQIISAAQAIQRIFLDDDQIIMPEVRNG